MVRAETHASKGAFPRKAASAAPSCMVNVPFHFYCPKELLVATGISQSSQRGCWWWNKSLSLLWCPATLQPNIPWGSPPVFTNWFLPAAHLSLDFTLEIGLKPQFCSIFVTGKFFTEFCQTSLRSEAPSSCLHQLGLNAMPCIQALLQDYISITFSYRSCCAVLAEAKFSGNWQQTQKLFQCCPCLVTFGSFTAM